jgi:protein TonB
VTVKQPGDVVAKQARGQAGIDGFHRAVLIARRDEPSQSEATDLSNVIPFARPRRQGSASPFPLPSIAADERPAPQIAKIALGASITFFAASLALHAMLAAMFWHQPKPMLSSVDVQSITIEITTGAAEAAGLAPSPGEREARQGSPSEQTEQQSRAATVMPQEAPVAAQETAPKVEPQEQQPEAAAAVTAAPTQPTEATEQPQVQTMQQAPERNRIAAPTEKKAAQKKQAAVTAATNAASGVGRGRSDISEDRYRGIVAAHLMRHKQYPPGARGEGRATVTFAVDSSGHVTSSQLVDSSGNAAFDREVVAMARRASPFPAPPEGKARKFTVSVRFEEPGR